MRSLYPPPTGIFKDHQHMLSPPFHLVISLHIAEEKAFFHHAAQTLVEIFSNSLMQIGPNL